MYFINTLYSHAKIVWAPDLACDYQGKEKKEN